MPCVSAAPKEIYIVMNCLPTYTDRIICDYYGNRRVSTKELFGVMLYTYHKIIIQVFTFLEFIVILVLYPYFL